MVVLLCALLVSFLCILWASAHLSTTSHRCQLVESFSMVPIPNTSMHNMHRDCNASSFWTHKSYCTLLLPTTSGLLGLADDFLFLSAMSTANYDDGVDAPPISRQEAIFFYMSTLRFDLFSVTLWWYVQSEECGRGVDVHLPSSIASHQRVLLRCAAT